MPSPEAFSFTRYGDIPVGLFTGTAQFSVPLFNLKSGKLSVPVSLNYASNGIKVDAVSGRTGMDWTLNAGGVITRNIIGRADDEAELVAPTTDDPYTWSFYSHLKTAAAYNRNTQPDEFTYNFLGHSGKFYFDYQRRVRELSPSGMKIIPDSPFHYGFTIIDQAGTSYRFENGDYTYSYSAYGDNDPFSSQGGKTAWYLTKVKNQYGDSIVYAYGAVGGETPVNYYSDIKYTYRTVGNLGNVNVPYFKGSNCGGYGTWDYWEWNLGNIANMGLNSDLRISSMSSGAYLSGIVSREGRLKLDYSSREDLPGELKLDSITLFNNVDNRISSVGLGYRYSQSNLYNTYIALDTVQNSNPYLKKRLFLDRVSLFNNNRTDSQYYRFDYDSINALPPRLSCAQDHFGYFNGKHNINLLPSEFGIADRVTMFGAGANRNPDTLFSKKGMLKKITYPTGGYTLIDYQSNYLNGYGMHEVFDTITLDLDYSVSPVYQVYSDTFMHKQPYVIKLSAEWITPPDYNGPLDDSTVFFKVINAPTNTSYLLNNVKPGFPVDVIFNLQHFNAFDGSSILSLEGGNPNVRGKAQFIQFLQVADTVESPTGGVRVCSTKNYHSDGQLANGKHFDYSKPDGTSSGTSVLKFYNGLDYVYPERSVQFVATETFSTSYIKANYVVSSSSIFNNYANDYGTVNYEYVTETFDSAGNGGSIVSRFLLGSNTLPTTFSCGPLMQSVLPGIDLNNQPSPNPPYYYDTPSPFLIPGAPMSNTAFYAGKERSRTVYRKSGGVSYKQQETTSHYSIDDRLYHVDSFLTIRQAFVRDSYINWYLYLNDYEINQYKRNSAWVHVDSTVQKEYDYLGNELVTKTSYVYGNASHLLPTEVTQLASDGSTLKKVTRYTHDLRQLDTTNSILNAMLAANMTAIPLVNKSYRNTSLLSTDSTVYNSSLLPATFSKSKGSNSPEQEGATTQYDALGNAVEFNVRGQVKSLLVDTSTGQLLAGCENAAQADIAHTSFEVDSKGNWSYSGSASVDAASPTGTKYYQLAGGNITKSGLTSGTAYVITYWKKDAAGGSVTVNSGSGTSLATRNGWTLYRHEITGSTSVTVSGSAYIDELRLHPKDAMMTTYTYIPLVGMSSQCDANNKVTYYGYDSFNRLKLIKDQDGNIVKVFDYKYQAAQNQ